MTVALLIFISGQLMQTVPLPSATLLDCEIWRTKKQIEQAAIIADFALLRDPSEDTVALADKVKSLSFKCVLDHPA